MSKLKKVGAIVRRVTRTSHEDYQATVLKGAVKNITSPVRRVPHSIRIEQPRSIKGRRWFFLKGIAGGFGAEYGMTLDKRTVERRCAQKAGAGKLVNIKGAWHWLANAPCALADLFCAECREPVAVWERCFVCLRPICRKHSAGISRARACEKCLPISK